MSNAKAHMPLLADWFNRSSLSVAVDLLGCTLAREIDGEILRTEIVETEAYEAGDPAMFAYRQKTKRNAVVFGPAGMAYIYRIYQQYHCFNIVTDRDGFASTILIRAVELSQWPSWLTPTAEKISRVAAGPGKLCLALQLDESLKGIRIYPDSGLWVEERSPQIAQKIANQSVKITQTTRIGLSKGADLPWRWYLSDSPAVSKKATSKKAKP
jgi:DNA-3-methyladenine glycosylase